MLAVLVALTSVYSITRVGTPVQAAAPTTLNFQARLMSSAGNLVPDGTYNIEFKLYNVNSGGSALWTETRTGADKVQVKNGYLSAYLGDVTALPSNIWNQQLWLTMNIGGTGAASWDGEMTPRIRLTSVPFAFRSTVADSAETLNKNTGSFTGTVDFATLTADRRYLFPDTSLATTASPGTICVYNGAASNCPAASGSAYYIQNDTVLQTQSNFNIQARDSTTNGTVAGVLRGAAAGQTVDLLQFQASGGSVLGAVTAAGNLQVATSVDTRSAGTLSVGTSTATAVSIGKSGAATTVNGSLTVTEAFTASGGATITGVTNINTTGTSVTTIGNSGAGITLNGAVTANEAVTFNNNVTVAAGKTIRFVGDTTANRPASPSAGMVYFDTDTKQLLVYANGKWQADRSTATKIVGTSATGGSSGAVASVGFDGADYVNASTTSAQTVINSAISSLPATGGSVYLMEGTYVVDGEINVPSNVTLVGSGPSTIIKAEGSVSVISLVNNSDKTNGNANITVKDMTLDGNSVASSGVDVGGDSTNILIENLIVKDFDEFGVYALVTESRFINNRFIDNNDGGLYVDHSVLGTSVVVAGNYITGGTNIGLTVYNQQGAVINNNTIINAASGASFGELVNTTIANNVISGNIYGGIYVEDSSESTITGNILSDNGDTTDNLAIYLDGSDSNNITSNIISDTSATSGNVAITIDAGSDTNYLADNTLGGGSITNSGTGTIYGGQLNGSNNFVIQPAAGSSIELMRDTNVTGNLTVTGDGTFSGGDITVATATATDDRIKVSVAAGGAARFDGTITSADLTAARTWTLPDASGTICLDSSVNNCSYLTTTLAATNYIQNQNAGAQSTSNFWISGTGRADTSFTTPLIDTPTAAILNIGTTNATGINLNKNVVVAASQSLTLTGGNTASRPASPTEGMMYYDTTTKQLLIYANGKWQADSKTVTYIVAASDSSQSDKDGAQYVANGETSSGSGTGAIDGDQVQINDAIDAAAAAGGGTVFLMSGTYTIDAPISIKNNVTLAGTGAGSLVRLGNFGATSTNINAITNNDTSTGTNVTIRDIKLDGRSSINTSGTQYGIAFNGMGNNSASRAGGRISNVVINNFRDYGIWLFDSSSNLITGVSATDSVTGGLTTSGNSFTNTISNSVFTGGTYGIVLASGGNLVSNNVIQKNTTYGLYIGSGLNTLTSNLISDTGGSTTMGSIYLTGAGAASNSVTNNSMSDTSCSSTCLAIIIDAASTGNYIADNTLGGGTISNGAGASTILAGQTTGTTFAIQPGDDFTITGNAASTISTTAGNLTLQAGSGTVSLGTSTALTASGALSLTSGGATALSVDTGGAATLNIGVTNANAVSISKTGVTTTVNGALTVTQAFTANGGATITGVTNINTTGTALTTIGASGAAITLDGATTVNNSLSVSGSNTLTVGTGATTLGGTLTVAGTTTMNGTTNLVASNATTQTSLSVTANSLTTGTALGVTTASTALTSGNLVTISQNSAFTSNTTISNQLLNVSRTVDASVGAAAITHGNDSNGNNTSSVTGGVPNLPISHTIANHSNRLLLVAVSHLYNNLTVTYNGTPLTKYGSSHATVDPSNSSNNGFLSFYYLVNPTIGTANIVITSGTNGAQYTGAVASDWYNVDPVTPFSDMQFNTSNSDGYTNITVDADEVAVDALANDSFGTYNQGAGQTLIGKFAAGPFGLGSSYKAGAHSQMSWSFPPFNGEFWGHGAVVLNPASGTGTITSSGSLVNFSNNCLATCTDSSSVLTLNQQVASATGTVLNILNSGTGLGLAVQGGSQFSGDVTLLGTGSDLVVQGTGTSTFAGSVSIAGNLTVANTGNVAFQRNTTDFTTTGTSNDVNFGTGVLFRINGASAQTITSIAGGADGRIITIVNAGANAATFQNDSGGTAANRIITGTGSNLSVPAGATIELAYDSAASRWRVIGGSAVSGGGANQQLSNLSGTVAVNASLTPNADNTLDLGSAANSWRTLYADTSVLTPTVDTATATTLNLGTTTANAVSISRTGVTTTVNGALTVTQGTQLSGGLTVTNGGNVAFQRNTSDYTSTGTQNDINFGTGALFRITSASALTITSIAGGADGRLITLINDSANAVTISNDSGGTAANRIITGTGASITIPAGASLTLAYDSSDSRWRVIGATAAANGYLQLQNSVPGTAQTGNFNISGTGIAATSLLTPSLDSPSGVTSLSIGISNATAGIYLAQDTTIAYDLTFSGGTDHTLIVGQHYAGAGGNLTVAAGQGGADGNVGGNLTLQGGAASSGAGNLNGGSVTIAGGAGVGTGTQGLVNLSTTAFTSSTVQSFGSAGVQALTSGLVDAYSTIPVNATVTGVTVSVPDPAQNTIIGRVLYLAARNGSQDFTLRLNAASTPIDIAMKANSTATLIWNGTRWTAAGASSSTDLQSAYNNTLTSAGGAEILLNPVGGSADGFTIRNNGTTPIIGGLLEVQSSIGSNLLSVNNNATEYAVNGGAESSTNFSTNWTTTTGGTVDRWTTLGNFVATGVASTRVQTTTTNHGAKNVLSAALTSNMTYSVSFAVRGAANFTTLQVLYSPDGTTSGTTTCATGKTVTEGAWTRILCTFVASGSINSSNAILIRQTDATARTFYIDNLSVNVNANMTFAADGSVDSALGTNWTAYDADGGAGTSTPTRTTGTIYDTTGAVSDVTTAHINQGVRNNMPVTPSVSTQYLVTFYAKSSNTFNDITVGFLPAGGSSAPVAAQLCVDYNTQSVSTSSWTKITCLITTPSSGISDPDLVIYQPTATARTFYVDALTINLNTNNSNNVQIGGANKGGPTTLLTLDRASSAPIAANNDAYLGSMYYDTTTGRIQCYEADGWGACGSSPDNIITLTPEYTGAVLGTPGNALGAGNVTAGIGVLTADFCSNEVGVLVTPATGNICATHEARNFYRWTSPQATEQVYSIYVSYKLPTTFKAFNDSNTIKLTALSDNLTNAIATLQVFKKKADGSAVTSCGGAQTINTSINTWQQTSYDAGDETNCGFSGGDNIVFKIDVKSKSNGNIYIENLDFVFTNN